MNQSELEAKTCNGRQVRETMCDKVTIGFGFTFDWLIKWRGTS